MASPEIGIKLIPENRDAFKKSIASSLRDVRLSISAASIQKEKQRLQKGLNPKIGFEVGAQSITKAKRDIESKLNPKINVGVRTSGLRSEVTKALRERFLINVKANINQTKAVKNQIQRTLGNFRIDLRDTDTKDFERKISNLNKRFGKIKFNQENGREYLRKANQFFIANPVKVRTELILPNKRSIAAGGGSSGGGEGGRGPIAPDPGGGGSNRFQNEQKKVNNSLRELNDLTRTASKETFTFGERIGFTTARLAAYLIPASAFFQLTRAIGFAREAITDINRDLTRLTQVFNGNAERASQVAGDILNVAKQYGQSGRELLNLSVLLAQSGAKFSSNDSILRVVEGLAQTQLGATFGDLQNVTEGTIAVLNQFSLAGENFNRVLDVANILSKNFAFEAENLFSSVRRGGAAFAAAGGSFEEFAAVVAAIREETRLSAEVIGTSLNTLSLRLIRPDVVEFLEEFRGGIVDIRDESGNLKGVLDIFIAIADATKGLGTEDLGVLLDQVSGIRQGSRFIPLIRDLQSEDSTVRRSIELTNLAPGSVARDAAIGADRIDVQIGRISASFEKLFGQLAQDKGLQNLIKNLADTAETVSEVIGEVSSLIPLLIKLGGVQLAIGVTRNAGGFFRQLKNNNPGPFDPGAVGALTSVGIPESAGFGSGISRRSINQRALSFTLSNGIVSGQTLNRRTGEVANFGGNISQLSESEQRRIVGALDSQRRGGLGGVRDQLRIRDASTVQTTQAEASVARQNSDRLAQRRQQLQGRFQSFTTSAQERRNRLSFNRQGLSSDLAVQRNTRKAFAQQIQDLESRRPSIQKRIDEASLGGSSRDRRRRTRALGSLDQLDKAISLRKEAMNKATARTNQLQKRIGTLNTEYAKVERDSARGRRIRQRLIDTEKSLEAARAAEVAASRRSRRAARGLTGLRGSIRRGADFVRSDQFRGTAANAGGLLLSAGAFGAGGFFANRFDSQTRSVINDADGTALSNAAEIARQNALLESRSGTARTLGGFVGTGALIGLQAGGPLGSLIGAGIGLGVGGIKAQSDRRRNFQTSILNSSGLIASAQLGEGVTTEDIVNNFVRSAETGQRGTVAESFRERTGGSVFESAAFASGGLADSLLTGTGIVLQRVLGENFLSSGIFAQSRENQGNRVIAAQREFAETNEGKALATSLDQITRKRFEELIAQGSTSEADSLIREERARISKNFGQDFLERIPVLASGAAKELDELRDQTKELALQFRVTSNSVAALNSRFDESNKRSAANLAVSAIQGNLRASRINTVNGAFSPINLPSSLGSAFLENTRQRVRANLQSGNGIQAGFAAEDLSNRFIGGASIQKFSNEGGSDLFVAEVATELLVERLRNAFGNVSGLEGRVFSTVRNLPEFDEILSEFNSASTALSPGVRGDSARKSLENVANKLDNILNADITAGTSLTSQQLLGDSAVSGRFLQGFTTRIQDINQQTINLANDARLRTTLSQRSSGAFDSASNTRRQLISGSVSSGRITGQRGINLLLNELVDVAVTRSAQQLGASEGSSREAGISADISAGSAQSFDSGSGFANLIRQVQSRSELVQSELATAQSAERLARAFALSERNLQILNETLGLLDQEIGSLASGFQSVGLSSSGQNTRNDFLLRRSNEIFDGRSGIGQFQTVNQALEAIASDSGLRDRVLEQVSNVPLPALQQQILGLQSRGGLSGVGGLSGAESAELLGILSGIVSERRFGRGGDEGTFLNLLEQRSGVLDTREQIQRDQLGAQQQILANTNVLARDVNGFVNRLGVVGTSILDGQPLPERSPFDPLINGNRNLDELDIRQQQKNTKPNTGGPTKNTTAPDESNKETIKEEVGNFFGRLIEKAKSDASTKTIVVDNNASINVTGLSESVSATGLAAGKMITAIMKSISEKIDGSVPGNSDIINAVDKAVQELEDKLGIDNIPENAPELVPGPT